MSHHSESVGESPSNSPSGSAIPTWVDYLVGAGIALVGFILLGVGTVLTTVLNRSVITDLVREGTVQGDMLTEAELIEVAVPTTFWTGIGLVVVGLALLAAAGVYVYYQRQFQRRTGAQGRVSNFWGNAVVGAVATMVFSFVPFSQALGGGVAGYLEHDASGKSTQVGAVSGVVGVAPALLLAPFIILGVAIGANAIGDGGLTALVGVVVAGSMLFGAVVAAALGALGGYAGGYVAGDRY